MNFDVFTIAALVKEFRQKLVNGRIQDSLEIGNDAIGLEVYAGQRCYLMLSANPQAARVHIVSDRVRKGVEHPSPLGLMLRRNVEGGRLVAVSQPPWERVMHIEFESGEGAFTLIAEIMDRRSNLLLVRDGIIMDCMRRVGADENRVRVSLPGQVYIPPPPQLGKLDPTTLAPEFLANMIAQGESKQAWRLLTEHLLGFSPMLAKEVIYRAAGDVKATASKVDPAMLGEIIQELITPMINGMFEPGVTEADGLVTSYSAYEVTHLPGWHAVDGISEALATFYGAPVGEEAYNAAKQPIQEELTEAIAKVSAKVEALRFAHKDQSELERLKQSGELILAYQFQIKPGDTLLKAQYDFDQPELEIKIDPKISPLDNAKDYFDKYERAKRAAAGVPAMIEETETELAYLHQLEVDLKLASNVPEIGEVQDALQVNGYWRGTKTSRPHAGKSAPIKAMIDGFVVWVGRNSRQNEDVTFGKGRPEDTWLHVRGVPGAHVVIKNGGRPIPPTVLHKAAALAAYYSPSREEGHVLVDVTERRYVRKIKGGQAGMVTYRNETPIDAVPSKEAVTE